LAASAITSNLPFVKRELTLIEYEKVNNQPANAA
jgi:hypothetical protein